MNEEINCISDRGKMAKKELKIMTLTFFKLETVYIKN